MSLISFFEKPKNPVQQQSPVEDMLASQYQQQMQGQQPMQIGGMQGMQGMPQGNDYNSFYQGLAKDPYYNQLYTAYNQAVQQNNADAANTYAQLASEYMNPASYLDRQGAEAKLNPSTEMSDTDRAQTILNLSADFPDMISEQDKKTAINTLLGKTLTTPAKIPDKTEETTNTKKAKSQFVGYSPLTNMFESMKAAKHGDLGKSYQQLLMSIPAIGGSANIGQNLSNMWSKL
jgi:hypothetical protein